MVQGFPFFIPPLTFSIDAGTIAYHWVRGRFRRDDGPIDNIVSPKDVTIVISAHGDGKNIEDMVRPMFKQTYPLKNIYISDSNIDNTGEMIGRLSKEFPSLHYWSRDGVTAKSEKINSLVRDPNVELGDYVYLKDASAKMGRDVIERLVAGFGDDNTAAVTSFGFVTPPESYLAGYFHYGKEWANRLGKFRKTAQQYRRAMFVVCGASFMVRSDILKEIEIPIGTKTEDTAYTWLLQEKGYKIGVVRDAIVNAEDVATLDAQLRQSFRWFTGTWQNIFLNAKQLLNPGSKARSLGYSTVLPGLIESTLYTGTIVALPIIGQYKPEMCWYFLIGDTVLSLASPLISTVLAGEPKKAPMEFLKTLRHYHQITACKLMSSLLWLGSGAKVVYDLITGRSKEWSSEWEKLPETQTAKPYRLTKRYLRRHMDDFLHLEKEWRQLGEQGWAEENFMLRKPKKWKLSSYVSLNGKPIGYTIVSKTGYREGFLHKIIVDGDYQGLGIGSKLFEDMRERCKRNDIEKINFKVRTDNESAKALYRKYGVEIGDPVMCPDNVERYQCELKIR